MRLQDMPWTRPIPARLAVLSAGLLALALALCASGLAQRPALKAQDYGRAERFLGYNANPLVLRAGVRPNWLPDDRFWYRLTTEKGVEFILVDPARSARGPAFNQTKVARALSQASGAKYEPFRLPFTAFIFEDNGRSIAFNAGGKTWTCDVEGMKCTPVPHQSDTTNSVLSPDRQRAAFIREFNLWVRDVATGKETQLTKDGVKDFGYATDNAGWTRSDRPV